MRLKRPTGRNTTARPCERKSEGGGIEDLPFVPDVVEAKTNRQRMQCFDVYLMFHSSRRRGTPGLLAPHVAL